MGCSSSGPISQNNIVLDTNVSNVSIKSYTLIQKNTKHEPRKKCDIVFMDNNIKLNIPVPSYVANGKMIYDEYIKYKLKNKNKDYDSDETDIADDKIVLKKTCVEMIKRWTIDRFVNDKEIYMYLVIGFYDDKIRYVPGRFDCNCNLLIKNNITDEIMIMWWHSGEFFSDDFIVFFDKLLYEKIRGNNYYFQKVINGIYVVNFNVFQNVKSIYKFDQMKLI
jgi:hypothetical protein